jgi:hypothetical protein
MNSGLIGLRNTNTGLRGAVDNTSASVGLKERLQKIEYLKNARNFDSSGKIGAEYKSALNELKGYRDTQSKTKSGAAFMADNKTAIQNALGEASAATVAKQAETKQVIANTQSYQEANKAFLEMASSVRLSKQAVDDFNSKMKTMNLPQPRTYPKEAKETGNMFGYGSVK